MGESSDGDERFAIRETENGPAFGTVIPENLYASFEPSSPAAASASARRQSLTPATRVAIDTTTRIPSNTTTAARCLLIGGDDNATRVKKYVSAKTRATPAGRARRALAKLSRERIRSSRDPAPADASRQPCRR